MSQAKNETVTQAINRALRVSRGITIADVPDKNAAMNQWIHDESKKDRPASSGKIDMNELFGLKPQKEGIV